MPALSKVDNYDIKILKLLHENARISVKEISGKIHLSQPSCTERIKKLEALGIIRQYTTLVDWELLGSSILAIVHIQPLPTQLNKVEVLLSQIDKFIWSYKVTGEDCYICQIAVTSIGELDNYLSKISTIANTRTSIIKSTIFDNKFIDLVLNSRHLNN